MDRRTLLFIVLSTVIFLIWATLQRPHPPMEPVASPLEEPEATTPTATPNPIPSEEPTPTQQPVPTASSKTPEPVAWAQQIQNGPYTTVSSPVYEIEVSHPTASLRAWRLLQYPDRRPNGQLSQRPSDLIALYGPDYAGVRIDGRLLEWEPIGRAPESIRLTPERPEATLQFRTVYGEVEIVKTFRFHYSDARAVRQGDADAWIGYAVDVELSFRNLSEQPVDVLASGYELRWGPGITADRELYNPKGAGAVGGLLGTGQLVTVSRIRDENLELPGPQSGDGDADDDPKKTTAWAALHSKYFVAALLAGRLPSTRQIERRVRFSEYEALPVPWPPEPARYRMLLEIGKEWLRDAEHLQQVRTARFLFLPTGKRRINLEIAQAVGRAEDTPKGRRKLHEQMQRIYAEYGNVASLLTGTRMEVDGFFLEPGQTLTDRFRLYAGPKHTQLLGKVLLPDQRKAHLDALVQFGITGPLAKGLLWILKLFYSVAHNYGVAIILLTILIRLILFPVAQRSSKTMKRMQTRMKIIQPEIDAVRKKYRDDPQRMNAEMLKIYRKYGVNPASQLGGCLMVLVQMPILFAMFTMLRNAAELRGEPFLLWIHDLTAPDLMFSVGGFPIRLLPLLVTGGTILQQLLSPMTGNITSTQRTTMYLMPVLFLFFFYGMASGLNLYWGMSTLIGVAQQYLVNRYSTDTEENLTAADLERMARQARKKRRERAQLPRL